MTSRVKSAFRAHAALAFNALNGESRERGELQSAALMHPDPGLAIADQQNSIDLRHIKELQSTLGKIQEGRASTLPTNDIVFLIESGFEKNAHPAVADFVKSHLVNLKRAALAAARRADEKRVDDHLEFPDDREVDRIREELEQYKLPPERSRARPSTRRDR